MRQPGGPEASLRYAHLASGPPGWECSPLLARLFGFDRTLFAFACARQEIQGPLDIFKDPLVLEFLKIPAAAKLVESDLEAALLSQLQSFLLELGKGFALIARQQRITLDGDHFYIDLVFYHAVLKCFVLLDLKVGKLTHQDLGQFQLYLNYYDRERRTRATSPRWG